jgi:hypothetical protein
MRATCNRKDCVMPIVVWRLSQPSSGLLREAQLFQTGHKSWCLWWITEKKEGGGRNEALILAGVEAVRRTEFLAYSPPLIDETYDSLVDLGETSFLSEVSENLRVRTSVAGLRHLAISFDASPLFEFVGRDFEYSSSFDVGILESNLRQRLSACVHPLAK